MSVCDFSTEALQDLKTRLVSKVLPSYATGCWLWSGARLKPPSMGYGMIKVDRKQRLVHRVSYQVYIGRIPDGFVVMHKCDNPACINPEHLTAGTQAENLADCRAKKRTRPATGDRHGSKKNPACVRRGERHGMAKLKTGDVVRIKSLLKEGVMQKHIAEMFGVSISAISGIRTGKLWRSVAAATA